MYGPAVCAAKRLAVSAEPGSLRVSAVTHTRLAGEWPWTRAPPRPVRLSDSWTLRMTDVDAEAVQLAKERSGHGAFHHANGEDKSRWRAVACQQAQRKNLRR